jgi:hypothetical protein
LQSIMGAPVFSRSSFTWAAEMFAIVVLIQTSDFYCCYVVRWAKTSSGLEHRGLRVCRYKA